jgi:hypothetical protein
MNRERALQVVLTVVGLAFIFGIYTFIIIWPSGWSWHTGQSHQLPHYLQMILGVYATLGVFLLMASRHPAEHRSLIAFAAWSSIVHGAIMGLEAFETVGEPWPWLRPRHMAIDQVEGGRSCDDSVPVRARCRDAG